jgi:3-oxoacyl-[acyl-carrier-protein] synthase II
MTRPRVVITGIGIVSALGPTRESTWNRMVEGACGIGPITTFATDGYRSRVGAEVSTDSLDACFSALERRRWSRSDRFGVVAAAEAIEDADLLSGDCDRTRIGVLLGAGTADLLRNERFYQTMLAGGIARTRPSDVWNHFSSTPVDVIAARFGLEGLRSCVVAACSSSTIAIGQAADAVRSGRVDAALAGGTDALCQLTFSGFNALKLMDPNACRPFDRGRAGMSIGEGAAILVLETLERARGRGAFVYAELAGYGLSCEAFHPTAPEPDGRAVSDVVGRALRDARVDASEIDHISAHGTATPQNDRAEARGFARTLGARTRHVPVTSIKSMIGHCLGAAGGLEAAILALTVARGVIPPTINHTETDPDCAVDVVANAAREQTVRCGVSTSLAFGGNDSAVVIRAAEA